MELIQHKNKWYIKSETGYREVLATTDESLILEKLGTARFGDHDYIYNLPQPSQSFIKAFVKAGGIDKVLVEYVILKVEDEYNNNYCIYNKQEMSYKESQPKELNYNGYFGCINRGEFIKSKFIKNTNPSIHYKLKTDSHNTITIKEVKKKMYSKKKVEHLILAIVKDISYGDDKELLHHYNGEFENAKNWIKENL